MSIDHKVSFPKILYNFLTIYHNDTGSKAHIAYFLKFVKAQMLSYNSSCKGGMSLVCIIKVKVSEYKSKVIGKSKWNKYNVIEWQV